MSQKSKWVETSYIVPGNAGIGEQEILLPLRCCVEVRKNRIRTLIQKLEEEHSTWKMVFRSQWVQSPNAHRAPFAKLDEAACVIADTIEDVVGEQAIKAWADQEVEHGLD